jgi:hypothetical protein
MPPPGNSHHDPSPGWPGVAGVEEQQPASHVEHDKPHRAAFNNGQVIGQLH